MSNTVHRNLRIAVVVVMMAFVGCVEKSSTIVAFDVTLESTSFDNQLLTSIVLYRNAVLLDTLPARTARKYLIGAKGVFTHKWRIVPPLARNAQPAGIAPDVDLGVQYGINTSYTIDYNAVPGRTIFTPRIINSSVYNLVLWANYLVSDPFSPDYVIPSNTNTSLTWAPYYYWNSNSNVYVQGGTRTYLVSRLDTNAQTRLRLDDSTALRTSGATTPILVY